MTWHELVGSFLLGCTLVLSGCQGGPAGGAALTAGTPPPRGEGNASVPLSPPRGEGNASVPLRPSGGGVVQTVARAGPPESAKPGPVRPVCMLGLESQRAGPRAGTHPAARIVAVVDNEPIFLDEVQWVAMPATRNGVQSQEDLERIQDDALKSLIERELLVQDAVSKLSKAPPAAKILEKLKEEAARDFDHRVLPELMRPSGFKNEDDFRAALRHQPFSLEMLKRQHERRYLEGQYLSFRIGPMIQAIGHTEIWDYYQKHPEEFRSEDRVEWQSLFVEALGRHGSREESRRFAEGLADRLRRGEDIARLLEFDDGDSRLRQGAGRGNKRGQIDPPEAESYLFRMKPGEVGPLIERHSGFHVFRLVSREYAGPVEFNAKVQKRIRQKLIQQVHEKERKELVNQLRLKADVEILPRPW